MLVVLVVGLFGLTGCNTLEEMQGEWFARDATGDPVGVLFEDDKLTLTGANLEVFNQQYKIVDDGTSSTLTYYQIKTADETYTILFPFEGTTDFALLFIGDINQDLPETSMLTIGRYEYFYFLESYEDYLTLVP